MPEAARVGDPIAHTQAMNGLLIGLVAGAALAVLTVATGGLAGVVAAAAIAGGAAGGGLAGAYIGETIMGPPCGAITVGSMNVYINHRPAGFVELGMANCAKENGALIPIAQGSDAVFINQKPSARKGDKLTCSAVILEGSPNVIIGGPQPTTYLPIDPEIPPWLTTSLQIVALGSLLVIGGAAIIAGSGAAIAGLGGGLIGGHLAAKGARSYGESMGFSETTIRSMEVAGGFAGGMLGGGVAARGTRAFNSRYQVTSQGMGSNFGNVKITRRPQTVPSRSTPFRTRIDPKFPGRPDPKYSVDTSRFNASASGATRTAGGAVRDSKQFWTQWQKQQPGTLSRGNQYRIKKLGLSPKVDNQWIKSFPEHSGFKGQTIEHHHINSGRYAIPLPWQLHRGAGNYNIWH